MKNLSNLSPVFFIVIFAVLACKNPFRKETVIVNISASPTPTATVHEFPTPDAESGTVLNEKATSLPKPVYPKAAQAVKASGAVNVAVEVDEKGNVTKAQAVSGHPLLRASAEQAARSAKFKPSAEKSKGVIVYNFTIQ